MVPGIEYDFGAGLDLRSWSYPTHLGYLIIMQKIEASTVQSMRNFIEVLNIEHPANFDARRDERAPMAFPTSVPLLILLPITFGLFGQPGSATDFVIYSDPPTALLPGQMFDYDLTPQGLPYGPASLVMQPDCNLVLFYHGDITWATNTTDLGNNCYLTIDSHGEALLLSNMNYPVWRSNVTSVLGSYAFLMQWNADLAIFGPAIWSSSNEGELSDPKPSNITTDYVFYSNTVLPIGKILEYKNFKLVLRDDCNLVLLDINTGDIKWQTNSYSPLHDCFVTLGKTGELFVKHNRREILWKSNNGASTSNSFILVLRYDAKLVIFGPRLWKTELF